MADKFFVDKNQTVDNTSLETSKFGRLNLNRFTGRSFKEYPVFLVPLIKALKQNNAKVNFDIIHKAFIVAEINHRDQKRKSGDPYIVHPVAVAVILATFGMGTETLVAALLHDTVEDTDYTLAQLRKDFGEEVALMVDGVTKLDKITYGDAAQAETVRKMVIAMAKDVRVLLIKLADRLHNARTWKFVSSESSTRKAKETLEIFAPLAHRLGMNTIKWELEDLSFEVLLPKVYKEIVSLVSERSPEREKYLLAVSHQIKQDLKNTKIRADIVGRPKHYYSIYQKMIIRDKDFKDIYDLIGIRVLVDSVQDCYAVLGCLHSRWNPLPGRFKDYIAMPKFNMYQSLHTTVIGPSGRAVEIQIRTYSMDRKAEYGVAAHWKYKNQIKNTNVASNSAMQVTEMDWLKQLADWQKETADSKEFLDSLRFEIGKEQLYVFTPKGEVLALPAASTPVDFAYAVHTEVGNRTVGARVNGKLVPLNSELHNGDSVEIFISKAENAGPSQDWRNFVKSPRARNKIKQWFSRERREEKIDEGKKLLSQAFHKQNLSLKRLMTHESLTSVANKLSYPDVSSLYAAIGQENISVSKVVEHLLSAFGVGNEVEEDLVENVFTAGQFSETSSRSFDVGVTVVGVNDVWIKIARCCLPMPPDKIVGFVTRGSGVSVHRDTCANLLRLQETDFERIIPVQWEPNVSSVFLVQIQVEALDRSGLFSDVSRVFSDNHVNIISAFLHTSKDRLAVSRFVFELGDTKYLEHILEMVRKIEGVFDSYRVYD